VPRAPSHHVVVPPYDERPRLRLGGWRGQACPLVPPGRRDIIVRDLHRRRLGAASEGGLLLHHRNRLRPRLRGCRLLLRRRDHRLLPRLAATGDGRVSTTDVAGSATTTGASAVGCTSVADVACCASTTVGARRSSATTGCGPVGDVTGRGPEASVAPCEPPLALLPCLRPPAAPSMSAAWLGWTRPPSAPWPVRGGTVGATLRTRKRTVRPPPVGRATPRKQNPYLKEEKARFLFLEAPADVVGAPGAPALAPPTTSTVLAGSAARTCSTARAGAPEARTDASAAPAASVADCLVAGASAPAPGDGPPATGVCSGDGGAGSHLSGRTCPLSSSSSSSSDNEYSSVSGEESPCCSRSRNSSLLRSRRSRCRASRSLLRSTRSRSRCCAARVSVRDRGVGGSNFAVLTLTICRGRAKP
jgi:hypothetical protein